MPRGALIGSRIGRHGYEPDWTKINPEIRSYRIVVPDSLTSEVLITRRSRCWRRSKSESFF